MILQICENEETILDIMEENLFPYFLFSFIYIDLDLIATLNWLHQESIKDLFTFCGEC